jgi:molybdate transport system regulatory protein
MPNLRLRIDLDPGGRIGPGKIELLEQIAATGSISAAGRAMNMSYKRAWDLVHELNTGFGAAVAAPKTGGKNGGGAALTPLGALLVEQYRSIERSAAEAAAAHLAIIQDQVRSR